MTGPPYGMVFLMTQKADQLFQQFLQLPDAERWAFIGHAFDVLETPSGNSEEDDQAFAIEMHSRAADVHEGRAQSVPAEDVYAKIEARLRRS